MTSNRDQFPLQRLIWPGSLLASIAHAIFVCRCPDLAHEQSWDGSNYNVQDSAGSRGTVAFGSEKFVGVFFYEASDRNPSRSKSRYSLNRFFKGLPNDLRSLAESEALQYVLQEYNHNLVPVITSAFWGDGIRDRVAAAEPWSEVFDHGAVLVENQLLDPSVALMKWASEYDLKPSEVALLRALFHRRIADHDQPTELVESERLLWEQISLGQGGVGASRESFAEIGIILP